MRATRRHAGLRERAEALGAVVVPAQIAATDAGTELSENAEALVARREGEHRLIA